MWKVRIGGLDDYIKQGFEFMKDEGFLYVFDRKYPADPDNPDEPLAIFPKTAGPKTIRKLLEGYMKLRGML